MNNSTTEHAHKMDMDMVIKKNPFYKRGLLCAFLIFAIGVYAFTAFFSSDELSLDPADIKTVTVQKQRFVEGIPLIGKIEPENTRILDVIAGGVVETVKVNNGDVVSKGQIIATLSNPSLLLEVTRNEALVSDQLNNHRMNSLRLEQDRYAHKEVLLVIRYEIDKLKRKYQRLKRLRTSQSVPEEVFDDLTAELKFTQEKLRLTKRSQAESITLQESLLSSAETSISQMKENLTVSRNNLDNLTIRAPKAGILSSFEMKIGESIQPGYRIGQIDNGSFVYVSEIDEHYIDKLKLGLTATSTIKGKPVELVLSDISPTIKNGLVKVTFVFSDSAENTVRRGQTLSANLALSEVPEALVVDIKALGGNLHPRKDNVYIAEESGVVNQVPVLFGNRNEKYIIIESGLHLGDQIITSTTGSFKQYKKITIEGNL